MTRSAATCPASKALAAAQYTVRAVQAGHLPAGIDGFIIELAKNAAKAQLAGDEVQAARLAKRAWNTAMNESRSQTRKGNPVRKVA